MKKILITGANSYIGESLNNWLKQWPEEYFIQTIDMKNENWKEKDFSDFDVIFHVAGIAHVSTDPKMKDLYYKVNRDLTIETARKAKAEGIKQFIFMSSIIVYGDSSNITTKRIVNKKTIPDPSNYYGRSKLEAEEGINDLESDSFKVAILRPPMIYGHGSKGNYPKLANMAIRIPIFPNINNQRSMLHIDNLCEFIRLIIQNEERGLYFPQNREYVNTSEMVRLIAETHGKKVKLTKIFNPPLKLIGRYIGLVNKVFGNIVYDENMSDYKYDYRVRNFKESIKATEKP